MTWKSNNIHLNGKPLKIIITKTVLYYGEILVTKDDHPSSFPLFSTSANRKEAFLSSYLSFSRLSWKSKERKWKFSHTSNSKYILDKFLISLNYNIFKLTLSNMKAWFIRFIQYAVFILFFECKLQTAISHKQNMSLGI